MFSPTAKPECLKGVFRLKKLLATLAIVAALVALVAGPALAIGEPMLDSYRISGHAR